MLADSFVLVMKMVFKPECIVQRCFDLKGSRCQRLPFLVDDRLGKSVAAKDGCVRMEKPL